MRPARSIVLFWTPWVNGEVWARLSVSETGGEPLSAGLHGVVTYGD